MRLAEEQPAGDWGAFGSAQDAAPAAAPRRRRAAEPAPTAALHAQATLERVLGLTIKAALLTAQRVLDLLSLWRITESQKLPPRRYLKDEDWWLLIVGAVLSTLLSACALSRHRCALRQNRPYGWGWAGLASLLQLAAVVEMVDKLGDGVCWGVLDEFAPPPAAGGRRSARVPLEIKGSRYGENLMRGLRKLCIANLPMVLLSSSIHLFRLGEVWVSGEACESSCNVELVALVVGIVCLAMASADVVLYVWVDDAFVKSHKKLVQLHYFVEILARQPIILLMHVVLRGKHGIRPLCILWACDVLASVVLLLLPTLRAWIRARLSCRHALSQVSTALLVSQLLFGVNITFFDPRDAFLVLNTGFYLVKDLEAIVIVKLVQAAGVHGAFFQAFCQAQLAASLVNAALVWVAVPWLHRAMEARLARPVEALPRLTRLLPGNGEAQPETPVVRRRSSRSLPLLPRSAADLPNARQLELGTVGGPQLAVVAKINASLIAEDSAMQLELLGDILEALFLLSQTQSTRNRPVLSRAMVTGILWSLALPLVGDYDDGHGGLIHLSVLDPERGAMLLQRKPGTRPAASEPEEQAIALVLQGTALEVAFPGEGTVVGTFDGRRIYFADRARTVWTRCSAHPEVIIDSAREVLPLVLTQLLLALRWEPTFLGLGNRDAALAGGSSDSLAAIDASRRPLLCFLIRYALVARDLALISDAYWSLWCLSRDAQDPERDAYDKARWALVSALQGRLEFWDGDRGVRLDDFGSAAPEEDRAFRRSALRLLVQHRALWRQTARLARLAADVQGDTAERTRVVRQQLARWRAERLRGEALALSAEPGAEDPYLVDVEGGPEDRAAAHLTDPSTGSFISLPADPNVRFLGVDIAGCKVLASATAPLLLACLQEPEASSEATPAASPAPSVAASSTAQEPSGVQQYMVKVGDDLRQDQLVLQLFALMERVWRERLPAADHEMLRLAPYRVLAMTPNAGYVKFVPGAVSLSTALCSSRGDLTAWLDANRPPTLPLSEALSNLCGSVAACCVATYCLGIGDRHLDNLQITPEGHFFHIDFGFILGDDPKPFAPRLRLPQPVASALRAAHEGERLLDRCLRLAGRAFVALRRSVPLWASLLRVTGEAGGAGCQRLRAHADAAVVLLRERLRSDLGAQGEEAAADDFLLVLSESAEALYPVLTDKVHQLGMFWK